MATTNKVTKVKTRTAKATKRRSSRRPALIKSGRKAPVRKRTRLAMSGVVLRMRNPFPAKGHPRRLFASSVGEPLRTQICLCYACANFDSDRREKNCRIANELFDMAVKHDIAMPVTRCPKFKPLPGVDVI